MLDNITVEIKPNAYFHINFIKDIAYAEQNRSQFVAYVLNNAEKKVIPEVVRYARELILNTLKFPTADGLVSLFYQRPIKNLGRGKYGAIIFDAKEADAKLPVTRKPFSQQIAEYYARKPQVEGGAEVNQRVIKGGYWRIIEYGCPPFLMTKAQRKTWVKILKYLGYYTPISDDLKENQYAAIHPGIKPHYFLPKIHNKALFDAYFTAKEMFRKFKSTRVDLRKRWVRKYKLT